MSDFTSKASTHIKRFINRAIHAAKKLLGRILRLLPVAAQKKIREFLDRRSIHIIEAQRYELKRILADLRQGQDYLQIVIFPPSLDWDVQLFQRPQQLALALARQGVLVFYLQPKPDHHSPSFNKINNRLYLCNVHTEVFNFLANPTIYLLTWNSDYANCFNQPHILYDFVDDINVFYGDHAQIVKGHQYLLQNAAIVLATAKKLVAEAQLLRHDVLYSPNGVDYNDFVNPEPDFARSEPEDLLPILALNQPIIGYYGALARWFDYDLLKNVAALRPNYSFVLIGPDYDGTLEKVRLSDFRNIHWLGVKPYKELPIYLHFFDAVTIPFLVNDITHATSPLKLFEYMAGGKPIVITPMKESMIYPGVLVGDTAELFAEQLDRALDLRCDSVYIESLRKTARENTWDNRAVEIIKKIEMVLKSA